MSRSNRRWLIGIVVLALVAGPSIAQASDCRYVQVADPCQNDVLVFEVGEPYIAYNIDLDIGPAGAFEVTGVDYATVAGSADRFSFVAQGPFLRVIDQTLAGPWRTMWLNNGYGVPGLSISKVDAAPPVTVGGSALHPLYLVGHRDVGTGTEPYFLVLDQAAILAGDPADDVPDADYSDLILAHGPVCESGQSCSGTAVGLAVSRDLPTGPVQEAQVSVLIDTSASTKEQRFYSLGLSSVGQVSVALEFAEGVDFAGSAWRALGVTYDSSGYLPTGVFQTSSVTKDLLSGVESCALPGDPTDVAVWGPDPYLDNFYYHFVVSNAAGDDHLLGFAEDVCPSGAANELSVTPGSHPRAIAISSRLDRDFWIYTANKDHGLTLVDVELSQDANGDVLAVHQVLDVGFNGCPSDIAFRDEVITACSTFSAQANPADPMPPPPTCPIEDPECNEEDDPPAPPPPPPPPPGSCPSNKTGCTDPGEIEPN